MALTLSSSNGTSLFTSHSESVQVNTHFNGGLTQTTSTVTPTRLKNIEEAFLEHSILPTKPFQHEHMAGFVPPSVNISLHVKQTNLSQIDLQEKPVDYYSSTNSNSNDSFRYSDEYSSETNTSSFVEKSTNYTFNNIIGDMNSAQTANKNNTVIKNNSKSRKVKSSEYESRYQEIPSNMASSQKRSPKKSTGGGRKPTRNEKLTPEEELKREKRRERNKLAAARCRKRRLDKTNKLMEETRQLEKVRERIIDNLNQKLKKMQDLRKMVELHESNNCKLNIRLAQELFSCIDYDAINNEMQALPEEDFDNDINTSNLSINDTSSNSSFHACNFPSNSHYDSHNDADVLAPPTKRKRPTTLPMKRIKTEEIESNEINGNILNNILQTPSNGIFFDQNFESGTGLTPLNPTLPVSEELTPSTMNALFKSLRSPLDEGEPKKFLVM